ncbi:hypothetical protein [Fusobacterium sp.]|uniref:hypothetical protein n=1 Tax=Fusobacterium sp. TaxID=68766 RepID=UPI0029043E29|nr:hypothetical protein [Fusobacterium sp.]MDU1909993.1 hypothetical protein [Fusobacterium sp.]
MLYTSQIKNLDLFKIKDDAADEIFLGCDQEWYLEEIQRRAGCGPTTAAMLTHYYRYIKESPEKLPCIKSSMLSLMNELWKFVTPGNRGIPTTEIFCEKFKTYLKEKNMTVNLYTLDVPEPDEDKPSFETLLTFLLKALSKDKPVAFLNLCSGEELTLDRWHWVLLVSIEYDRENNILQAIIYDESIEKKVNLALWLKSTTLGGGFVYMDY